MWDMFQVNSLSPKEIPSKDLHSPTATFCLSSHSLQFEEQLLKAEGLHTPCDEQDTPWRSREGQGVAFTSLSLSEKPCVSTDDPVDIDKNFMPRFASFLLFIPWIYNILYGIVAPWMPMPHSASVSWYKHLRLLGQFWNKVEEIVMQNSSSGRTIYALDLGDLSGCGKNAVSRKLYNTAENEAKVKSRKEFPFPSSWWGFWGVFWVF